MDSDGSRPGSSASSSSSDNSKPSSPAPGDGDLDLEPKSPPAISGEPASPRSLGGTRSRSASHSPVGGAGSPIRSPSKSDSDSSSDSSSDDNEDDEEARSPAADNGNADNDNDKGAASRPDSSCSSTRSRSNSQHAEARAADGSLNISHEELSDVSDTETERRDSYFKAGEDDGSTKGSEKDAAFEKDTDKFSSIEYENARDGGGAITDLRQKLEQKKKGAKVDPGSIDNEKTDLKLSKESGESIEDLVKTGDDEDLDFEAEEGECPDAGKDDEAKRAADGEKAPPAPAATASAGNDKKSDGEAEEGEELEEGEVSDEDEKRPEETEPKPVCRFYTRGQCTWGMSCRFLHPGVTDKGNYTMFDLVRPVSLPQTVPAVARAAAYSSAAPEFSDYRTERPPVHHRVGLIHPAAAPYPAPHHDPRAALVPEGPVVVESAWERGLRTAKEMMRKANKRKEQDMDFDDKKMNLTLSPDELEKDPYFIKERSTPPDVPIPYGRHVYQELPPTGLYSPPDRYGRGAAIPPYDDVDPYGRTTRYRELPAHRMPHYEDERRVRPTREVIVQRVEPSGRGDEWNDPWMRSKSPGGRGGSRERSDKRRRDRSYSSNSSYSSSSSTQSDSSSDSSRSPSPVEPRRRYNSSSHKASPPPAGGRSRHAARSGRSPSPHMRRGRHSPSRHSPGAKRRAHISSPPLQAKKAAYSPVHKRKKQSPVARKSGHEKSKLNRRHSSSSSGSSDSSGSDSDSDSGSSSSESSSPSREHAPTKRSRMPEKAPVKGGKVVKKVEPVKKRSPISIELKKPATVGASALAVSPTHSVSSEKDSKKSRREELLKQLRAVEDAIAKKRSKLT